jgi:hypothetical protein
MINFRFHLVSLIAVFLALALGIVMGSTVIDQAIVDGLRATLKRVEDRSDETRTENRALTARIERLEDHARELGPFTVDGRLSGLRSVVVAVRGVDEDGVAALQALMRDADAISPVVVWLEPLWALDQPATRDALRDVVGAVASTERLRSTASSLLAGRLADSVRAGGEGDEDVEGVEPSPSDPLVALADAGFVAVEGIERDALGAFPDGPTRVVVVGGPEAAFDAADLVGDLAAAFVETATPTVVCEVGADDDSSERGASLTAVRDDESLAAAVSTVDDLDLPEGLVATVLALEALGDGTVGHYGYGEGASAPIPEWEGQ